MGEFLDLSRLLRHKKSWPTKINLVPNDDDQCQKKFQNPTGYGRFGHFWPFLGEFSNQVLGKWGHAHHLFFGLNLKLWVYSHCCIRFHASIFGHSWAAVDSKITFYLKKAFSRPTLGSILGKCDPIFLAKLFVISKNMPSGVIQKRIQVGTGRGRCCIGYRKSWK